MRIFDEDAMTKELANITAAPMPSVDSLQVAFRPYLSGAETMVYQFNNVAHVTIAALLLALSFYASKRLVLHRRRQAFKRLHGAHDAPWLPTQNLVQRWIGLDLLWSNVRAFRNHNFLETSKQRIKETGLQTYQQTLAGSHTLLTIELDNLKAIQATNFKSFGLSEQRTNAHTLLGYSIFTTNGAAWAHSRELLRPQFVRAQVFNLARTFKPHVDELITALPRDRRSFNLEPFFFRLTMDTATEFLFGESTNSVATGTDGGFGEALTMAVDHTIRVARYGLLGKYLLPSRGSSAARDHVHRFVDNIVDRGLAKRAKERSDNPNVERRYCFLDALASETDDRLRIRSELLSVLMAGRSTTANLLTNVWFILSTRPDIWTKVQEEVATLGGTEPTIEQLKELKYVGAVVNESLRMHPVVAINTRLA